MEEQAVPAALTQHLPRTVWVEEPQEAQHPRLDHQLGVEEVKNGCGVVGVVETLGLRYFEEPVEGETVEQ